MEYQSHFITPKNVVIVYNDNGEAKPVTIPSTMEQYNTIKQLIKEKKFDEIILHTTLKNAINADPEDMFKIVDEDVLIKGEKLPKALADTLRQLASEHKPFDCLINLWGNLRHNPSEESKKDLYTFLDKYHMPITEDGCFIAYKYVDENYMDAYTHQLDNHVGCIVSMPRDRVDNNRNNHCSNGLHVCAFSFLSENSGRHIMHVKVNPRDVVSIPTDCNGGKIRVCRYLVIGEHGKISDNPELRDALYAKEMPLVDEIKDLQVKELPATKHKHNLSSKAKSEKVALPPSAIKVRADGRVYIPSRFAKDAKFHIDDEVYVHVSKGMILINRKKSKQQYNVGSDLAFKISLKLFNEAEINPAKCKVKSSSKLITIITK